MDTNKSISQVEINKGVIDAILKHTITKMKRYLMK